MERTRCFSVSVLLIKEFVPTESGWVSGWVAQGLEYDIAAQGKTIQEVKFKFETTFVGQIVVDVVHGREALAAIAPAPKEYWDKFNRGEQLADNRMPFHLPEIPLLTQSSRIRSSSPPLPFFIQAFANDMRLSN